MSLPPSDDHPDKHVRTEIYSDHELRSGVIAPFSKMGTDAITGVVAPVLNPEQPIASPRLEDELDKRLHLDIDYSFVFRCTVNRRPDYINMLEAAIALRRRRLRHVAKCFDVNHLGLEHVFVEASIPLVDDNYRVRNVANSFISMHTIWDTSTFRYACIQHSEHIFFDELIRIRSSHRGRLTEQMIAHLHLGFLTIKRLEDAMKSSIYVANCMKAIYSSVTLGQTPDLETVARTVRTAHKSSEMLIILTEISFYALVNPAYIFVDYVAHFDLFLVMTVLGRLNYGLIVLSKREAEAYLREIEDEGRSTLPKHASTRDALLKYLDTICNWGAHREMLADISRQVMRGTRLETTVERRQFWLMR